MEAVLIVLCIWNFVIGLALIAKHSQHSSRIDFFEKMLTELAKRFEYQFKLLSDRVTKLEDSDALKHAEARIDADIDRIVESLDVYTREISNLLKKRNWYQRLRDKNTYRLRRIFDKSGGDRDEEYKAYSALNEEYDRILRQTKKEIEEQCRLRGDRG